MHRTEFVDISEEIYMSDPKFIAHVDEPNPFPSAETNGNLLDHASNFWWKMKDDLHHALSAIPGGIAPRPI